MARLERLSYDSYYEILSYLHPDLYTILPTSVEHRQNYREYTKRKPTYKQSELLEFADYFGYYEILPASNIILHIIKHNCNDSFRWLLENDYEVNSECFEMAVQNNNAYIVKKLMNVPCPISKIMPSMTTEMTLLTKKFIDDMNKGTECNKEILNGTLESLKEKHALGFPLSKEACDFAGSCGNVEALHWLIIKKNKLWTSNMYINAIKNGHLNIIVWYTQYRSTRWFTDNSTWKREIYNVAIQQSQWHIVEFCIKQRWTIPHDCIRKIVKNRQIFEKLFDNVENQHVIHDMVSHITDNDDCLFTLQMLEKTNYYFKSKLLNDAIEENNHFVFNYLYRDKDVISDNSYCIALTHKHYKMFRKLVNFTNKCSDSALNNLIIMKNIKLIKYCVNCKVNFDGVILNTFKEKEAPRWWSVIDHCDNKDSNYLVFKFLVSKNIKLNIENMCELLEINTHLFEWYVKETKYKYNGELMNYATKRNNCTLWQHLLTTNEIITDSCLLNAINHRNNILIEALTKKHTVTHDLLKYAIEHKNKHKGIVNYLVQYKSAHYTTMVHDMIENDMKDCIIPAIISGCTVPRDVKIDKIIENCKANNINIKY